MARHSHWAKIKGKKSLLDAKKGQIFSKLAREIEIAARSGGNPDFNPRLRVAIEKAKEAKMPMENIERAIKRGTGEIAGEKIEEVLYEAYGPGGIAILIEGITDNKNRTLNEIKNILQRFGGKLVSEGGVRWMFERKGLIVVDLQKQDKIKSKEELEFLVIESGAEDFIWKNEQIYIYTKVEDLDITRKKLESAGVKIESFSLDWISKETIEVDEKTKKDCEELFETLSENEAVQEIYSNLKE